MDYKLQGSNSYSELCITSNKMPYTLQRVKKHLLLNLSTILLKPEYKISCFFFFNQKTKENAVYCEVSYYLHTVILSSWGTGSRTFADTKILGCLSPLQLALHPHWFHVHGYRGPEGQMYLTTAVLITTSLTQDQRRSEN